MSGGVMRNVANATRRRRLLALAVVALMLLTGCSQLHALTASVESAAPGQDRASGAVESFAAPASDVYGEAAAARIVDPRSALVALRGLPVRKGKEPINDYDRPKQFGPKWTDDSDVQFSHNGCDTRNDILRRDFKVFTVDPKSRGCKVITGVLEDPYTGRTIQFQYGKATSSDIQIDHVVALAASWATGAKKLSYKERVNLANDPRNLLAVDGSQNGSKSNGDAATWLPKNRNYWCTYITKQIVIKTVYRLWIVPAEKAAMERILMRC